MARLVRGGSSSPGGSGGAALWGYPREQLAAIAMIALTYVWFFTAYSIVPADSPAASASLASLALASSSSSSAAAAATSAAEVQSDSLAAAGSGNTDPAFSQDDEEDDDDRQGSRRGAFRRRGGIVIGDGEDEDPDALPMVQRPWNTTQMERAMAEKSSDVEQCRDERVQPVFTEIRAKFKSTRNEVKLTMQCKDSQNPMVMHGKALGVSKFEKMVPYEGPMSFVDPELIIATCGYQYSNGNKTKRHNIFYHNKVNAAELRRAALQMSHIGYSSSNEDDKAMLGLNVVVLQLDAVSRAHFLRSLKKTNRFLSALQKGNHYSVFNFSAYNVVGYDSFENFPTLYSGWGFKTYTREWLNVKKGAKPDEWVWEENDDKAELRPQKQSDGGLSLPNTWVWPHYRDRGYVTLHGDELCTPLQTVNKFFTNSKSPSDVRVGDVYCLKEYCCCCFGKKLCLGDRQSYHRSLEYLLEFQNNYSKVGRLATFNMLLGHEPSMKVLRRLDDPLLKFLKSSLLGLDHDRVKMKKKSSARRGNGGGNNNKNNNGHGGGGKSASRAKTVLILLSDHGIQYGAYSQSEAGQLEHKNPPLFVAMPEWILQRYPKMRQSLLANQDRFVSAYDIYSTLMHLPVYPKRVKAPSWSYSLLHDHIPKSRTCQDAKVPTGYCGHMEWKAVRTTGVREYVVNVATKGPDPNVPKSLLLYLADDVVNSINNVTQSPREGYENVCEHMTLLDVVEAQRAVLKGQNRTHEMNYAGELTWNLFKLKIEAVITRSFGEISSKLAAHQHELTRPVRDILGPRSDIVTFQAHLTLPPPPDEDGSNQDVIVYDSDRLVVDTINRVSERQGHEDCMKRRDPKIPTAYCAC